MTGPFRSGMVALVGRTNAGKSTLLNRLVGERIAIVSDKPQTTRHRILGIVQRPDAQVVFVDTPGVHRPHFRMNRRMMDVTRNALEGVDVVALLVDASEPVGAGVRYTMELLSRVTVPRFLLLNKVDRVPKPRLLPMIDDLHRQGDFAEVVPISALRGDNCDVLLDLLVERLPPGPPLFPEDAVTDRSLRFLAGELVREQLLRRTRAELPYTIAVVVDGWKEPEDGRPLVIEATILVETDSQKAIVIGRQGSMIRTVGTDARRRIEALTGERVYLDLRVKTRAGWRDQERLLDEMEIEG